MTHFISDMLNVSFENGAEITDTQSSTEQINNTERVEGFNANSGSLDVNEDGIGNISGIDTNATSSQHEKTMLTEAKSNDDSPKDET